MSNLLLGIFTNKVGYYFLLYSVGIIAIVLSVIAFQFKHKVTIIFCSFLGQTCWVIYFLLQSDLTSAISCALSAVMLALFSRQNKWKWATHPAIIASFIVLITGFSLLTFKGWTDIFPLLAGIFVVIANSRKNEKQLRQFSFLWSLSWLMNSILKVYTVAFVNDLFCTISTVVALVRCREKRESGMPEQSEQYEKSAENESSE